MLAFPRQVEGILVVLLVLACEFCDTYVGVKALIHGLENVMGPLKLPIHVADLNQQLFGLIYKQTLQSLEDNFSIVMTLMSCWGIVSLAVRSIACYLIRCSIDHNDKCTQLYNSLFCCLQFIVYCRKQLAFWCEKFRVAVRYLKKNGIHLFMHWLKSMSFQFFTLDFVEKEF